MKINPVGHGRSNNLHATSRGQGINFKLILFYDSGDAYIVSHTVRKKIPNFDSQKLYSDLKEGIENMDFVLKTPFNKMLKHNFKNTQNLLNYIKTVS